LLPAAAAAAAAAGFRSFAEAMPSGIFLVEDVKGPQANVGDFPLIESDFREVPIIRLLKWYWANSNQMVALCIGLALLALAPHLECARQQRCASQ
jgi:hypothetical protein